MSRDDPWASLRPDPELTLGRRIEGDHPLGIYWVISTDRQPGLLVRGIEPTRVPSALPHPKGIALRMEDGPERQPQLALFLLTADDQDVFLSLCRDVIASTAVEDDASAATAGLFQRLAHWQSLLGQGRPAELGPEQVRGLLGELWVLDQLRQRVGMSAALAAWVAPDDHPQDFALPDRIIEVKTRLAGSRQRVSISSLEQLEASHLPLDLLVIELVPDNGPEGRSLNAVTSALLAHASRDSTEVEEAARAALLRRGFAASPRYDGPRYVVTGSRVFAVREGFPRLLRTMVDARIVSATYVIDLGDLSSFEDAQRSWLPRAEAGRE